jgi:hypothetical protein
VFHIDEVGLLFNVSYSTLLAFRGIFIEVQGVRTVLSGKTLPPNKADDRTSPWDNFIKPPFIEVPPLTFSEAKRLVVEPAEGLFRFDEAAVEYIVAVSDNKPMRIQGLCADVIHYKYKEGHIRKRVTKDDVEAARKMFPHGTAQEVASAAVDVESTVIKQRAESI